MKLLVVVAIWGACILTLFCNLGALQMADIESDEFLGWESLMIQCSIFGFFVFFVLVPLLIVQDYIEKKEGS